MPRTTVFLWNGKQCETEIPLDELYVLYKTVVQKRANIIIQVFWKEKEVGLDARRIDPDATFINPVRPENALVA